MTHSHAQPAEQSIKRKTLAFLAYSVPLFLVISVMAFNIFRPILVLPRLSIGPGFGLVDISDEKITNETMRGTVVLYSFTYTNCEQNCPTLMDKMSEVRQRINEVELDDVNVEMVTITIDPERDTPEKMVEYAAQYGVTPNNQTVPIPWHFVTGANSNLVKIMVSSGFDLFHEKVPAETGSAADYHVKFVPMAVLIDGWGIIRAEYRQFEGTERLSLSEGTTDIDPDIILRDIGLIAEEARNSKGVASAAYEAAHLFACYPP